MADQMSVGIEASAAYYFVKIKNVKNGLVDDAAGSECSPFADCPKDITVLFTAEELIRLAEYVKDNPLPKV